MDHPTPLQRIATLEGNVDRLEQQLTTPTPPQAGRSRQRPWWTGGSLLLAQLQRRHPEVLKAYEQPADLTRDRNGRLSLTIAAASPFFVFVVTPDGDALLYPTADAPDWLMEGALIRALFVLPDDPDGLPLKLERPARFIAARPGEEWVFHNRGALALIPADSGKQAEEDKRQRRLWEELTRKQAQQNSDLRALKEQVANLERALQRLCQLHAVARTTPEEP